MKSYGVVYKFVEVVASIWIIIFMKYNEIYKMIRYYAVYDASMCAAQCLVYIVYLYMVCGYRKIPTIYSIVSKHIVYSVQCTLYIGSFDYTEGLVCNDMCLFYYHR